MGRLNPQLTHFSHPHPLELTELAPNHQNSICWGCRLGILPSRPYYSCKTCGFCLHATCFKLPRKISHPGDPNHVLVLVMSPSFHCKACGNPGGGLCFSCKECNHDYHSLCTMKPLSITTPVHHHPLCLEFKAPYGGQGFRCDLCGNPGLNQWSYSCAECGFDVHLDCHTTKAPADPQFNSTNRSVLNVGPPGNHAGFHSNGPNGPLPGVQNGTVVYGTAPGSYGPPNQMVLLTPNNGVPMTTVLQPNRSIGYSDRVIGVGSGAPQSGMSGMGGLIAGSIVTGMAQQLGQELVSSLTNGFGDGSGSSNDNNSGVSDMMNCWVGGDFL